MDNVKLLFVFFVLGIVLYACESGDNNPNINDGDIIIEPQDSLPSFISAVDISAFPEIRDADVSFYNQIGEEKDFLDILMESGINTIRLKMFVEPYNSYSGFDKVRMFSDELHGKGFKVWLTVHYSDTWADPGKQLTPERWKDINYNDLQDSIYNYTNKIVKEIKPDYIQIGNEINNGFIHPTGHISDNGEQFLELLETGITAVRDCDSHTQIILHYAGIDGAQWFCNFVEDLDYDLIGLSFYPIWHGKSLQEFQQTLELLQNDMQKDIVIAETAYPFTLDWNDWTHNIVGLEEQLILPEYPATIDGQKNFIMALRSIMMELNRGKGLCYWGAELVAWKGEEATDCSPWENQALFDFDNSVLPALKELNTMN